MPKITMPLRELGFGLTFERKAVRFLRDLVGGFEEGFENFNEVIPVLCISSVLGDQAIEVIGKAHGVPPCGEQTMMASTTPLVPCVESIVAAPIRCFAAVQHDRPIFSNDPVELMVWRPSLRLRACLVSSSAIRVKQTTSLIWSRFLSPAARPPRSR